MEKETRKGARAIKIVDEVDYGISGQVLAEFYSVVTTKGGRPLTADEAFAWIEYLAGLPCVPIGPTLVMRAIANSERYRISYWDGAIVAAAEMLGATTLYTEDLSHGQMYGSVRAENPFIVP